MNLKIIRKVGGYELQVLARRGKSKITPVKTTFVPSTDMVIVASTAAEMLKAYRADQDARRI